MSLTPETKEILMFNLFYSPNVQATSIRNMYDQVKNKGIKYNEVIDFIKRQETTQLFKKQNRPKHYFPIVAKYKFEILQVDLVDMSNIDTSNNNYKYLLVAVDVFSRLAFVVPVTNKKAETITEAMTEIIQEIKPTILNTDLGSEFISADFKRLMNKQGTEIRYVDKGDHTKLGVVDRFCRTLRERINKYLSMHTTTKYIDVLPKLIENYNLSYHSGIKKIPAEVKNKDEDIIKLINRRYNDAKKEEIIFKIDDTVRFIKNREMFQKGTLPSWSAPHKIIDRTEHSYKLDNGKYYKYYLLQKVNGVQKLDRQTQGLTREEIRHEKTVQRKFKQSGLDTSDIITSKRKRKQTNRLTY